MSAVLDQLAEALGPIMDRQKANRYAYKHDTSGTPSANQYSHGPGGLLSFPGVDPAVFNASMGARSILSEIPAMPSVFTNPTYFTFTGVQADSGDEKDGVCDNAPIAGLAKGCLTTSVFGRYERATPLIELNRLGQRVDRADPMDLRLVGTPLATGGPFQPASDVDPTALFANEVARKFWERNVAFHRQLAKQAWSGNPSNNSGGGGYKELTGLQLLVNTGYTDAETGQACSSVDSYVRNFNYGRVDGAASQIVAAITDMYFQVKDRALGTGLMPVRWMFAMKPQLFYELTAVWPCSYLSYRCDLDGTSANRNNIDARDATQLRDSMRAGNYLLIDGDRVDVILDDGIPESDGSDSGGNFPGGCFSTDIYLLPFSVVGGQSVLFMEYFQYQNPAIQDALGNMVLGRIEGAFITWPRQTNLCIQWQSKIEPRMVLRTPWLAARLQNVVYCPIQHVRDPFPEDPYHVDGGKTYRSGPSYYNLWNE